jgi:hypothetical protein
MSKLRSHQVVMFVAFALAVGSLISPRPAVAQAPDPRPGPSTPVTIVNPLPVPVSGSATVSGSVAITNTPLPVTGTVGLTSGAAVTIANTATNPVPIKAASDPLFQQAFRFEATFVGRCAINQQKITVPDGQILVIDNVYVQGAGTKGARVVGVLQIRFANSFSHPQFSALFSSAEPPSVRYPDGRDIWDGNFPTKFVAQAGDSVFIDGCTGGPETAGNMFVEVVVTGHFVAVP